MPLRFVAVALLAALCVFAALGCSDDEEPNRFARPGAHLLSEWLGIEEDTLDFVSAEPATWPNGCMGIEWPGRVCTQAIVNGHRVEFRTDNGGRHFVHVSDHGDYVWAPIWDVETEIVSLSGQTVQFAAGGEFSRLGRLTSGSTIEGTLRPGARVFAAESSATVDNEPAPIVILVVLDD